MQQPQRASDTLDPIWHFDLSAARASAPTGRLAGLVTSLHYPVRTPAERDTKPALPARLERGRTPRRPAMTRTYGNSWTLLLCEEVIECEPEWLALEAAC